MALIREMRSGRDSDGRFFHRFQPQGAYAATLRARCVRAQRAHGLDGARIARRSDLFRCPGPEQLQLFGQQRP